MAATAKAATTDRLGNLSTRAALGEGSRVLTVGFVISAGEEKTLLLRGIGPGLRDFGFTEAATNPRLVVYDATTKVIAENDDWDATLAPVFSAAGAFALAPGSRDAALQLTLPPGLYTAQLVSPSGVGLVEAYDLAGAPKLVNLSTRGYVGRDRAAMVGGVIHRAGPTPRKVLVRAVGPSLRKFNLTEVLEDPVLTLYDASGRKLVVNDDWSSEASAEEIATTSSRVGAFALDAGSRDAALIVELPEGATTCEVTGKSGGTGVALLEVYDLMPVNGKGFGVEASPDVTALGGAPAQLVFSRSGKLDTSLTLQYTVGGTAQPGIDYAALPGAVTIPAGFADTTVPVSLLPLEGSGVKTVQVTLQAQPDYDLLTSSATIQLYLGQGTLFLASLRPPAGAAATPAFGQGLIQLTSDERYLVVGVDVSGLSSAQTLAYLRMQDAAGRTYDLVRLPLGQVADFAWQIRAGAGYSTADVLANLRAGRVFVQIDTAVNPGGEVAGYFSEATGSRTFTPPPAPADLPVTTPTPMEAARFLTQATFGPRAADVDRVVARGYRGWIDDQMALPASLHRPAVQADFVLAPPSATATNPSAGNRMAAWWKIALQSEDQLRQRVALALSEILVVSDVNGTLYDRQEALAAYYDLLVSHAFGDFRQLLEKVTLSPIMGAYLSSLRNAKATSATGPQPDENYAREVMQLFSIGLWQLQPDGTLQLGPKGRPVPTYDQTTITEMARVFTGWGFYSTAAKPSFRGSPSDYFSPMMLYPTFHDDGAKTIVGGKVLPAGQGGTADLSATLDALVQHPNTGPFLARQLIQRLVTSNPSPAYVYRVGRVYVDNGAGMRGDLGAMVRALLLDPEARAASAMNAAGQGKLKEPLLRLTALLRAGEVSTTSGRFPFNNPENALGQAPLRSPTVFNFFEPGYAPPGVLASAGLRGPEFQILNANTALSVPNLLYSHLYSTPNGYTLNLAPFVALVSTPADLIALIDLRFCAGRLTAAEKARLTAALTAVPKSTSDLDKVRMLIYLVVTTASGAVQR